MIADGFKPSSSVERADTVPLRAIRDWVWRQRKLWRRRRRSLKKRVSVPMHYQG